ncbi:hypothetical protein QQS21_001234 [Conoideocrella luteorostrata]|uniref:Ankyrin repeat protein n=1 Tax=Conoideocrella luteorostrata TaxID=1105319 RepID=A0AAJ0CXG4_9HYPO|nr:hypothetical protein QQS21_001234 [Conoideocrella luteorostrata]
MRPAMTEIDEDEIQPVLFDLVQADDVESVKTLLQRNYKLQDRIQEELLNLAAFSGSATMLDLLWEKYVRHNEGGLMWRVAISSIEGENEETLTFILSKMLKDWVTPNRRYYNGIRMCANMLSKSVSTGSMNVLNLVEDFMVASSKKSVMASAHFKLASMAMNVIRATGQCPEKEDWVSNLWLKLGARHEAAKTQHRNFGAVLHAVARTTLSIRFAQKILGYGVSVDNRKSSIYPTPLQSAAKRSSAESAKFIEFLLHQGANPDTRSGRYGKFKSVREEIGAQEIAKWLNVSWDDLIQKVKNEREKADSHTV